MLRTDSVQSVLQWNLWPLHQLEHVQLSQLKPDVNSSPVEQHVPGLLPRAAGLGAAWTFDHHMVSAGWRDKMKSSSVILQPQRSSSPFPPALFKKKKKIWKPSPLLPIFLWRDMKWAHIINISILFDCSPNKSHCSNKHRALLHCLPLSGFKLLTLQLTIYYRHLSRVTDKHCDGCMILLCQNGFISLLQATISTELMSWAYSLSPGLLSFSRRLFSSLRWQPLWALSSKEPISPATNLFSYLLIELSTHFVASSVLPCLFASVYVCLSAPSRVCKCRWVHKHMHLCVRPDAACTAPELSRKPWLRFLHHAVSHCYSTLQMKYPAI